MANKVTFPAIPNNALPGDNAVIALPPSDADLALVGKRALARQNLRLTDQVLANEARLEAEVLQSIAAQIQLDSTLHDVRFV